MLEKRTIERREGIIIIIEINLRYKSYQIPEEFFWSYVMIMERAWFSKVLEERTLRGKGRKDVVIKLNPTFNPNSQNRVRISWREEFFVFWVDDEMLKACIPFYFLIFDENNSQETSDKGEENYRYNWIRELNVEWGERIPSVAS